jgi:hypothetical protein
MSDDRFVMQALVVRLVLAVLAVVVYSDWAHALPAKSDTHGDSQGGQQMPLQEFPAEFEDPNILGENKEPPRATFLPFADVDGVAEDDWRASPFFN